ncbi:tetratricopeptide repeat protein [Planctomycetaceae bacterium SH139]
MSFAHLLSRSAFPAIAMLLLPTAAFAQLDRVYPEVGKAVTGQVTTVQPDGIQVKVGSAVQNFRIDQLQKVTFEGDPGALTRGRELALEGQYQSALEQLKTIDLSAIRREFVAADAMYYRAASQARLALAGQGDKAAAINELRNFVAKFPRSLHFYDTAELLGDLAIATGDYEGAAKFYGALGRSVAPLVKQRAAYLVAMSKLRQGVAAEAIGPFEQVLAASLDSAAGARLQVLAAAGRAVALAQTGKGEESLAAVNKLIEELNPDDAELAARIYNARGAANEALGDKQAALLDYLHTQLLFSSVVDAHAEALSRLVTLWPAVGKPEEAARARQELQSRYPGWGG